jgi:hypothetical protein
MSRQFHRLQRIKLRTSAQKRCPAGFARRLLIADATSPFPIGYSTMIGHDPRCRFVRGGSCDCEPDITLSLPDGQIVTVDVDGRVQKAARQ